MVDVIAVLTGSSIPRRYWSDLKISLKNEGSEVYEKIVQLKAIEIRKALTDEWERGGMKEGVEFAILTDEICRAWTGMATREYKNLKDLKKENLRDNMTNLELVTPHNSE